MRILNAYIRSNVIYSIVVVLLIVAGLEILIEFLSLLGDITAGNYSLGAALVYVLMQLPIAIYQFFPMVGFLGCLIGLGRLASSSELIVMRSAGVSVMQVTGSVIRAATYLIVLITLFGECLAPQLSMYGEHYRNAAMNQDERPVLARHVWLREGSRFIYIDRVPSKKIIEGVTVFDREGDTRLRAIGYSAQGVYRSGVWHLKDMRSTIFGSGVLHKGVVADWPMSFHLNFKVLGKNQDDIVRESSFNLLASKQYREREGLDSAQYELAFWMRILQPVTSIIMICLGVPFMFGSLRNISLGTRIVTGVFVGFSFYMVNQFFGSMTLVYQWPPLFVATLPPLLFGSVCIVMLLRTR